MVTEAQREIWSSLKFGDEANCAFNESLWLTLDGVLDEPALEMALQDVFDRHEILRATFSPDGETLCIRSSFKPFLERIDLTGKTESEQQLALADFEYLASSTPFDLICGTSCAHPVGQT